MALRITVDIFSGRPNPVLEVADDEASGLLERMAPARLLAEDEPTPDIARLGYRGLVVEQLGDADATTTLPRTFRLAGGTVKGRGLAHRPQDEGVEEYLLGQAGPLRGQLDAGDEAWNVIDRERVTLFPGPIVIPPIITFPFPTACTCGPIYEPGWWNVPARQPDNNCYNYATNYRTDTFAQPGRAAGAMYPLPISGAGVKPAALADQLVDAGGATAGTCPPDAHLVALVIWPGADFHWYRRDKSGWWSHKPGSTPATNKDNSNKGIINPQNADRGNYTEFVGYMVVMPGHVKIT